MRYFSVKAKRTSLEPLKIFLAGGKNFGKTTYLTALYAKYAVRDESTKLFCTLSAEAESRLSDLYHDLKRGEWARATAIGQIDEYPFTFNVSSPKSSRHYPAATTVIYDYPGGAWSGEDPDPDAQDEADKIRAIAEQSDAIVLVVCGSLMQDSLRGGPGLNRTLSKVLLRQLRQIVANVKMNGKPVYFIVSKWDLFEDSDASVARVRKALLQNPFLEDFVQSWKSDGAEVRLVPVSSVGAGFAQAQSDGTMKIRAGREMRQLNVEIPLSAILRDRMKAEINEWRRRELSQADALRNRDPGAVSWWKGSLHLFATYLQHSNAFDRIRQELGLSSIVMNALLERLKDPYETHANEIESLRSKNRADADAMLRNVDSAAAASDYGMQVLLNAFEEYRAKYPSADLTSA